MTDPTAAPGRRLDHASTPLAGDLLALGVGALVVQLAFWHRVDLPAHVVAGGGFALAVGAVAPRRAAPWIAPITVGLCLVLAVISELLQPGVLDYGDVAYTGAGSLLVARSTTTLTAGARRDAWVALAIGVGLVVLGIWLRYGR